MVIDIDDGYVDTLTDMLMVNIVMDTNGWYIIKLSRGMIISHLINH